MIGTIIQAAAGTGWFCVGIRLVRDLRQLWPRPEWTRLIGHWPALLACFGSAIYLLAILDLTYQTTARWVSLATFAVLTLALDPAPCIRRQDDQSSPPHEETDLL